MASREPVTTPDGLSLSLQSLHGRKEMAPTTRLLTSTQVSSVCVRACACVRACCVHGGKSIMLWSQFFTFAMWVPGIELRFMGLAANTFLTHHLTRPLKL